MTPIAAMLSAVVLVAAAPFVEPAPPADVVQPAAVPAEPAPAARPNEQVVPEGTPVRLMVLHEISSRTGHVGDKFMLRVDEPVYIDGKPVIPVGTKAWGEIVSVQRNGAAGKSGRLATKLLYVDLPGGRLPLRGSVDSKGDGNSGGVLMAVVGFGIFGLLTAGDSARLKGGQTFTAYVDKMQ